MTEAEDCGLLWPSPLGIAATSPQGIQQHSSHRARENGCDYYSTIFPDINSFDITILFSRSPLATLDFTIFSLRDHLLLWAITLIMCCTLYSDDSRSATWQVLDCPIFILFLALYYGNWAMSKLPAGLAQLRSPSLDIIQPSQYASRRPAHDRQSHT